MVIARVTTHGAVGESVYVATACDNREWSCERHMRFDRGRAVCSPRAGTDKRCVCRGAGRGLGTYKEVGHLPAVRLLELLVSVGPEGLVGAAALVRPVSMPAHAPAADWPSSDLTADERDDGPFMKKADELTVGLDKVPLAKNAALDARRVRTVPLETVAAPLPDAADAEPLRIILLERIGGAQRVPVVHGRRRLFIVGEEAIRSWHQSSGPDAKDEAACGAAEE